MTPNRAQLLGEAESLLRSDPFTKEISSKIDSLLQLADRTVDHTEMRRAVLSQRDRELGRAPVEVHEPTSADTEFRTYLRAADSRMARELEKRAGQNVGTGSAGGYLSAARIRPVGNGRHACPRSNFRRQRHFETQNGDAFFLPILDDATMFAEVVPEGTTSNTTTADVVFAAAEFPKIQTFRSGLVGVSWELMADSAFDVEALLARTFGRRLARGIGRYMVGVLHDAAAVVVTAASATVVTADEVVNLMDALDADYQDQAAFLMSQQTLNAIHKLKSSTGGGFMFPAAQDATGRQLLMGRKVFVSPSMGLLAAVGRPIAYGDLSQLVRRTVAGSVAIKAFPERYAEQGKTAFESYLRCDAKLLATTTSSPIVLLSMLGGS